MEAELKAAGLFFTAIFITIVLGGCSQTSPRQLTDPPTNSSTTNTAPSYFKARALDFMDIFDVSVSVGGGVRIHTDLLLGPWGLGVAETYRARLGQRSFLLHGDEVTLALIPFPASLAFWPLYENAPGGGFCGPSGSQMFWYCLATSSSFEEEEACWPPPYLMETTPGSERSCRCAGRRPG